MKWANDRELFALIRSHLSSSLVGDVLDLHGQHNQFLPARCLPLTPEMVVVGRAMTVLERDVEALPDPPFGKMLEALDSLKENEVYVAAGCPPSYAMWGELMSTAALARGAIGAVIAGYVRDTTRIVQMGFPTFCFGSHGKDQRGRGHVLAYRIPLEIEGVSLNPGDIVVGDVDGVVVLPLEFEVSIVTQALEQAAKENVARKMLATGASARDVFMRTGVL